MNSIKIVLLGLTLIGSVTVSAQELADTIVQIPDVQVSATALRKHPVGAVTQKWKTTDLATIGLQNISELLNEKAGVFIKSYGSGSLATSSIRGGSAGHTLVLWNGLPIQSPMLGLLDLSLLPVHASEDINFSKGGSSAHWGSGAIGGTLSLNHRADFSNRLNWNSATSFGSFGQFHQQINFGIGNEKIQSLTKLLHRQAKNDFSYSVAPDLPEQQQEHASFQQQHLLQDIYFKISNRQLLSAHLWLQKANREIPPLLTQTRSIAHQDDQSKRLIINWQYTPTTMVIKTKFGIFDEDLDYFDDAIKLVSLSRFTSLLGEATLERSWSNKHKVLAGINHNFTRAYIDAYQNNPKENQTAIFGSYQYESQKVKLSGNIRQAIVDGNLIPLVPVAAMDYQLSPLLLLKAKISKNYRLPTFNDRYWRPGGNENLKPEQGWSQELTLTLNHQKSNWSAGYNLTGFNRLIGDWILWRPLGGTGFWSATNVAKVWSRGIEQTANITYVNTLFKIKLNAGYNYIRSTNQVTLEAPRIKKGEQLLYTPIHQAFAKCSLQWKQYTIAYRHQMIGETNGINEDQPDYQLGQINIHYQFKKGKYKATAFFNLHNIWMLPISSLSEGRCRGGIFKWD